jgi:hypothetical protein
VGTNNFLMCTETSGNASRHQEMRADIRKLIS